MYPSQQSAGSYGFILLFHILFSLLAAVPISHRPGKERKGEGRGAASGGKFISAGSEPDRFGSVQYAAVTA